MDDNSPSLCDELWAMDRCLAIENANDELEVQLELHPDTAKELQDVGIDPEEFTRRFQETQC